MDQYKDGLLERLRYINEKTHKLRAEYYKLEEQLNELIDETEHLIEDIEDFELPEPGANATAARRQKEVKVTLEQCRKLVNKKVRILNPNAGEPNYGYIKSAGSFFVTIIKTDGDKTKRAAKNLRLIQDE